MAEITRSAYTAHRNGHVVHVPASREPDRGLPGKGPKTLPPAEHIGSLHRLFGISEDESIPFGNDSACRAAGRAAVGRMYGSQLNGKFIFLQNLDANVNPQLAKEIANCRDLAYKAFENAGGHIGHK